MEQRNIYPAKAPNTESITKHSLLPTGDQFLPQRYLFSVALAHVTNDRSRAEHDFRNGRGDADPDDSDNKNPSTRGVQVRQRIRRRCGFAGRMHRRVQVPHWRVTCDGVQGEDQEGCVVRWTAVNPTIWKTDTTVEVKRSPHRACYQGKPDVPPFRHPP